MKTFLLALCFFSIFVTATAQTAPQPLTIKGIAVDSATLQPIGYATVALMDVATQKSVRGTLTKDDGSFELKSVTGKAYQLVIAVVGYTTKTINIKASDVDLNLGKISLSASKNQLKEVSVFAVRPILKREVDRISYDVQADPESVALTGLDMMRKVPLLAVDANENILLKGSGNYKILINGRESALVAKNPSDFLKAMPASNIEKIEVITTPPAKYDAEGLAGIINIITKKNADQGYNATISGRYNSVFGPGLNLNANAKQGKLGLTIYAGGNRAEPFTAASGNTENIFGVQTISQAGSGSNQFHNAYGDAELSYEIDTLNLLTASFQMYKGGNNQSSDQFSNAVNSDGSIAQQYDQTSSGYNTFGGLDASINYQIGFKKSKDQLLTLSYKYSYSPNSQYNNNLFSQRLNFPGSGPAGQPDFYEYNNAGSKEHTLQVDYAQPFKKVTMEVGAKAILRNNFSDFNRSDLDSATNQYNLNSNFTDDFNYKQNVYSLYNSYQVKLEKWTGKIGLRLEHTTVNADFTTNDTTVHQGYNNLIPSVSIQRSFKTSSFNLGFTQRIQRPGIYQLNPYIDNSDPKFISQGNPNLRPELNNSFELNYSNFSKNSFNAGLSYQFSNNAIQNVTNLLPQSDVSYTTYENLGSNKTLGFNVNMNIAITKKFTINLNGQVSKVWLAANFNGQAYENTGFTGNAFGNLGYKFNDDYRLGIDAGYFSGGINLQGSSSSFIYNAAVFTKTFLNKKATISLVANCPEAKFHNNTSYNSTAQFYQYSYNQNPYRTFAIRFSYKIGKLNSEIKKNQHGINNDDTKDGKSAPTGG